MEMTLYLLIVGGIFKDYRARRNGLVHALTRGSLQITFVSLSIVFLFLNVRISDFGFPFFISDVDEFYGHCDPGNVCF